MIPCRPYQRTVLTAAEWAALQSDDLALQGFWADTAEVHALFADPQGVPLLLSTAVQDGHFQALSPGFAAAALPERMVHDLWGHIADGAADARPWLDHGHWGLTRPLHPRPGPASTPAEPEFRVSDDTMMQLPVGPVPGSPCEPSHLRVHTDGVAVRAVEARLGYAHKGSLLLMRGKSPRAAARYAARLSADATVAHAVAFARATEAALEVEISLRSVLLRGVMAEVERIATHLGDLAACCPDANGFAWHREQLLRATMVAFGHRMMMDCVVPGGLSVDLTAGGQAALLGPLERLGADLPELTRLIAHIGQNIGVLPLAAVTLYPPAGIVARSAGIAVDARVNPGYEPYQAASTPMLGDGDVAARLGQRLLEIGQSIAQLRDWLVELPSGSIGQSLPPASGEGLAVAEGPRGAIWHWLRLDGGLIASTFAADPSWRHWPLQEAASLGAALQDLALIDRSFASARSGIDL